MYIIYRYYAKTSFFWNIRELSEETERDREGGRTVCVCVLCLFVSPSSISPSFDSPFVPSTAAVSGTCQASAGVAVVYLYNEREEGH